MRYFVHIAYNGTNYSGWQIQPNAITIQQVIQEKLSLVVQEDVEVFGCGRTDAGVHASQYYFHFDTNNEDIVNHIRKINYLLPLDIVVYSIERVKDDAHARFDAIARGYEYHLAYQKDPFSIDQVYFYALRDPLDFDKLNEAASILLDYEEFYPFCKTNHDAHTLKCSLSRCEWVEHNGKLVFHIESNRFLRGMVRLIVGMCIRVANGNISLDDVRNALDTQTRLPKTLSVPAHGLYLTKVEYI